MLGCLRTESGDDVSELDDLGEAERERLAGEDRHAAYCHACADGLEPCPYHPSDDG